MAALLQSLSEADLSRLMQILNAAPDAVSEIARLLKVAEGAVAVQDPARALESLRQLAHLDPDRAEALLSEPALMGIRPALEQLLTQLTLSAKLHAEGKLAEISGRLEIIAGKDEIKPEILIAIAGSLIQGGGLANFVRSAAVSEAILSGTLWAPSVASDYVTQRRPFGSLRSAIWAWCLFGTAAIALCWWLQEEWVPIACGIYFSGWIALLWLLWRRGKY